MDKVINKIRKQLTENSTIIYWMIFSFTFTVFFCLGMSLSRYNTPVTNIYFGADNARAFSDIIYISGVSHYRIKVHPLMLMLIQPISLLINGVVHHEATTELILGSIAGACNSVGLYHIFSRYLKIKLMRLGILAIYVFSFSTMIFTSVPETFIFASVYLVMFWDYLLEKLKSKTVLVKTDYVILIFFGITSFGFTLTNYVSYLIGIAFLFISSCGKMKTKLTAFFLLNLENGIAILLLSKIQQLAWKGDTPFFLSTLTFLRGSTDSYEETHYMDFSISIAKFINEFKQTWVFSFIGGNIEQYKNGDEVWIGFSVIPFFAWVMCLLLTVLVLNPLLIVNRKVKNWLRSSKKNWRTLNRATLIFISSRPNLKI